MQKPDYVKNTRGEGISEDILECFYDNIAYTPFIHIEGANLGPRHLAKPRRGLLKSVSSENLTRPTRDPVDPYALILDGKLDSLRPSLKDVMDLDDTYSCTGSSVPDMDSLHQRFAKSGILQIVSARSRPDAFTGNPADASPGLVDIKVAKVGLLWRKDPKKKRTRSPWQEWGALLTFSQLYFFRDVNWVKSLMSQHGSQQKYGRFRTVVFKPPLTDFKPDGIMSTDDAVALLDAEYKRHKHAFLFVRRNSLEEVFLANSEADRDDWLAMLNYAAAFRTTGVRTKGMIAPNYEGRRYRLSRVASDSSLADREPPSPMVEADVAEELVNARKRLMSQRILEANEKLFACERQLDDLLRNARHLQTLTPVHARAREQVIMAAGRMAAKLKWARQDIWRTRCYKEVLVRDLGEEPTRFIEPGFLHLGTTIRESAPTSPVERTESNEIPKDGSLREISEEIDKITQRPPSDRRSSVPALAVSPEADSMKRHHSADNVKRTGSSAARLEREPSVLSSGSRMDVSSLGSRGSKLASPSSIDDGEERLLREAGLLEVGSSPPEKDERAKETSRVRRSLHRTLRDTRHTRRGSSGGKKARDSVSSAPEDEGKEGGGLSRKTPSFTVHGKKASIVTFGTEWQTMPPGERLKLRKPTPSEDRRTSDSVTGDSATFVSAPSERSHEPAQSLRSASTATRRSRQEDSNAGGVFGEIDPAPGHTAGRNNPDADTVSPTRAHTSNGRLAVPSEDAPASASSDEAADQEKIQHSPPEQAVSA